MKPERWQQIEQLYDRALEMEESRRASFLREACAGDDDLRRELEQLLAEGRPAESFMEQPALREIAHDFAATAGSSWLGRQIGNYEFVSLVGGGGMRELLQHQGEPGDGGSLPAGAQAALAGFAGHQTPSARARAAA